MNEPIPALPDPPGYLKQVCELLAREEPELWAWFAGDPQRARQEEAVRLDLLKSAVQLQPESHPDLHTAAASAKVKLQLDVPLALYQAQQAGGVNASISTDNQSAHVVFQGDLIERLDNPELTAVLGHELGHVLLWQMDDGMYLNALRMLSGLCDDPQAQPVYLETARLFGLYMEVFCDRCALVAQGDFAPVVASLIKIETGLSRVNVDDYLRQAETVRASGGNFHDKSQGLTHPELYIRTSALNLWHEDPEHCDTSIDAMIRGQVSLDDLDVLNQQTVSQWTRSLIDHILEPDWMRCEATLGHARLFFPDYQYPSATDLKWPDMQRASRKLAESYFVFVLLDFVTSDRDLLEPALAHTLTLAERLGVAEPCQTIARRELRLRKKQLEQIQTDASQLIEQARRRNQNREPDIANP